MLYCIHLRKCYTQIVGASLASALVKADLCRPTFRARRRNRHEVQGTGDRKRDRRRSFCGLWRDGSLSSSDFRQAGCNLGKSFAQIRWDAVSCRVWIFAQKAKGEVPDISLPELWEYDPPRNGVSLHRRDQPGGEPSVQHSRQRRRTARREHASFSERCSVCHGVDGSGGPFAPSLTRSQYNHGDSDLAIYKVLRDGVPGHGMQSAVLTLLQRLQVISHLKVTAGAKHSETKDLEASRLAIHVSDERLLAAGTQSGRVADVFRLLQWMATHVARRDHSRKRRRS